MPTSAPGSSARLHGLRRRLARTAGPRQPAPGRPRAGARPSRGFTLIELLLVLLLVAIASGVVTLALRDGNESRLEEEAARLIALLESARAEARATGLPASWVPSQDTGAAGFRFIGLPARLRPEQQWLDERTSAQVVGRPALMLGPDAILPPQRVLLSLGDRRLAVGTDGLAPFAVVDIAADGEAREATP